MHQVRKAALKMESRRAALLIYPYYPKSTRTPFGVPACSIIEVLHVEHPSAANFSPPLCAHMSRLQKISVSIHHQIDVEIFMI